MKRRDFLKGMAVTGAAASVGGGLGMIPRTAEAAKKVNIGQIKGLKVEVLSETSWFDNAVFKKNIMDYGGAMTNQYTIPWDWDNAGGYMTKITVYPLEGDPKVFLMDTGWNNDWVDYIYDEKSPIWANCSHPGKVDTMVLSHWHLDHYWGIESTLKRNPKNHPVRAQNLLPRGHEAAERGPERGQDQRRQGSGDQQEQGAA
jgi:7,8-dihydropterin-6-yl-methyl-4-(beta-D-ribofuranosyl)aminobenzene 5'-phosphate synthase